MRKVERRFKMADERLGLTYEEAEELLARYCEDSPPGYSIDAHICAVGRSETYEIRGFRLRWLGEGRR